MSDKQLVGFRPPADLLARIRADAEAKGQSLNTWLCRAVTAALPDPQPKPKRAYRSEMTMAEAIAADNAMDKRKAPKRTRKAAILAALLLPAIAQAQTYPPLPALNPPPSNWCTSVQTPAGKLTRWCGTLDQWREYAQTTCLRAEAIGRPPAWTHDNTSPYWTAYDICASAVTAFDKVTETARDADKAYQGALLARRKLGEIAP